MEKLKSIQPPHVLTPDQLACLAGAPRRDIVELLAREAPLTRAQIAARLRRPATSTHYQLERLIGVGLVVADGGRPTARRPETLYRLVAQQLIAADEDATPAGRAAMAKTGARIAAAAGRSFARAVEAGAPLSGPARAAATLRLLLRLDEVGLAKLNAAIDRLVAEAPAWQDKEGTTVALTVMLSADGEGTG